MDIFRTHEDILRDYHEFIASFVHIKDEQIRRQVEQELSSGALWPEPLIQFNPAFEIDGSVHDVVQRLHLQPGLAAAFRDFTLYKHQVRALELGSRSQDFIVTSGTGSGKSLTYISAILNDLLARGCPSGIQAVIVYPMNALINSQSEALRGFAANYEQALGVPFPVHFEQYTGQEKKPARDRVRESPPQILLTNYMMLELILTRIAEQGIRSSIFADLR